MLFKKKFFAAWVCGCACLSDVLGLVFGCFHAGRGRRRRRRRRRAAKGKKVPPSGRVKTEMEPSEFPKDLLGENRRIPGASGSGAGAAAGGGVVLQLWQKFTSHSQKEYCHTFNVVDEDKTD